MLDTHSELLKAFIFNEIREGGHVDTDEELDHKLFQSTSSLRLRWAGFRALRNLYDHEEFPLDEKLTGRELMTLKNYVRWPYFLPSNHGSLYLFTIKQSFLLKLQGCDVKHWLAEIYQKNPKQFKHLIDPHASY